MIANKYEISNFICPCCGKSFPIPRAKSMRRGKGHIKDLWCPFCKDRVKTLEIRPKDRYVTMSGDVFY